MKFSRFFLVFLMLILCGNGFALEVQKFYFKNVRLAQQSAFQNDGSYFSGALILNPYYVFTENFALGIDLGGTILKIKDRDTFVAPEYLLKANFYFKQNYSFELGAGAQTWINNGGTFFAAEGNFVYMFSEPLTAYLSNIFLGYSFINSDKRSTHMIRAGLGFSF
ncbi:MAG: hypothetical protein HQK51_00175 [Oligoflexia bacterium]|nr:hypothetical protein [Oligoflexia bacterium]